MITLPLLALTVLSVAAMHRYPALFIPRKSVKPVADSQGPGENWIEVIPAAHHREAVAL